jgi:hypothetical protein
MATWNNLPTTEVIEKTMKVLDEHGFHTQLVQTEEEAKKAVLVLLPKGSEVFTLASQTAIKIGITDAIDEGDEYISLRKKFMGLQDPSQAKERRMMGAAPDYAIGSVHAVTEDGALLIASNTGSQLSASAYGSEHLIYVIGVQKIVKNLDDGLKRIYEYSLPMESKRMQAAHGVDSDVKKILIIEKPNHMQDMQIIFINEDIGF